MELEYLNSVKNIIDRGADRNGTKSLFGISQRYDISSEIPLLTTRKMFWKGILEELLWMIRGDTNNKYLLDKNVKIWDANAKQFYKNHHITGFNINDLGPIYGFQWRHFGAIYSTSKNYQDEGIDQLRNCIDLIKNDPSSRRIILNSWNPIDLPRMCLPPCHYSVQWLVEDKKITTILTQRSADMILGVPFNIASYSILTYILARLTGNQPFELIHNIGDAHVYKTHISKFLNEQYKRLPLKAPSITVNPLLKDIDSISFEDITLNDYDYRPVINYEMTVTN